MSYHQKEQEQKDKLGQIAGVIVGIFLLLGLFSTFPYQMTVLGISVLVTAFIGWAFNWIFGDN